MSSCESLPEGVSWKPEPLFSFERSFEGLERTFGPPVKRDLDSNGWGPFDAWALRFSCGLEVLLWALQLRMPEGRFTGPDEARTVHVHANDRDFAHLTVHLGVDLADVSLWLPDRREHPVPRWKVMRSDDNGNVFEMCVCSTRCEADALVDQFEARGHKQMYWVAAAG